MIATHVEGKVQRVHGKNLPIKCNMAEMSSPDISHLTEMEYWSDYNIVRSDIRAAIMGCYTHRTLNHAEVSDQDISRRLDRQPDFWRIISFSLLNSLFIFLARILDSDSKLHSIYQALNATTAHPEFFSKAALRARKLRSSSIGDPNAPWLDECVQNAWEPTARDLRGLKKALAPHKTKFDDIYKPIRDQIAHIIHKDEQAVAALYAKTLKTDIDDILSFLHSLVESIWEMAYNGTQPNLVGDNYGFAAPSHKDHQGKRRICFMNCRPTLRATRLEDFLSFRPFPNRETVSVANQWVNRRSRFRYCYSVPVARGPLSTPRVRSYLEAYRYPVGRPAISSRLGMGCTSV